MAEHRNVSAVGIQETALHQLAVVDIDYDVDIPAPFGLEGDRIEPVPAACRNQTCPSRVPVRDPDEGAAGRDNVRGVDNRCHVEIALGINLICQTLRNRLEVEFADLRAHGSGSSGNVLRRYRIRDLLAIEENREGLPHDDVLQSLRALQIDNHDGVVRIAGPVRLGRVLLGSAGHRVVDEGMGARQLEIAEFHKIAVSLRDQHGVDRSPGGRRVDRCSARILDLRRQEGKEVVGIGCQIRGRDRVLDVVRAITRDRPDVAYIKVAALFRIACDFGPEGHFPVERPGIVQVPYGTRNNDRRWCHRDGHDVGGDAEGRWAEDEKVRSTAEDSAVASVGADLGDQACSRSGRYVAQRRIGPAVDDRDRETRIRRRSRGTITQVEVPLLALADGTAENDTVGRSAVDGRLSDAGGTTVRNHRQSCGEGRIACPAPDGEDVGGIHIGCGVRPGGRIDQIA